MGMSDRPNVTRQVFSGPAGEVSRCTRENEETVMTFMDKAKDFADDHDKQVDQGLQKAGDEVDERTGDKYSSQVDKAVDEGQERTGAGDTQQ
jgi:hypothetical protein